MMNKIFFLWLSLVAVVALGLLSSCKKEDEDPLVGTWEYTAPKGSSSDYDRTLVLNSDKTGTWTTYSNPRGETKITLWIASSEVITIQSETTNSSSYTSYSSSRYDYYISNGYLVLGSTMYGNSTMYKRK